MYGRKIVRPTDKDLRSEHARGYFSFDRNFGLALDYTRPNLRSNFIYIHLRSQVSPKPESTALQHLIQSIKSFLLPKYNIMVKIALAGGSGGTYPPSSRSLLPLIDLSQMLPPRFSTFLLNLASTKSSSCLETYGALHFHAPWRITAAYQTIQPQPKRLPPSGVKLVHVDYTDLAQLIHVLTGVNTMLSFVSEGDDPASPVQKRLIDAAVAAGVKRFAPSEWGTYV